MRLYTFGNGGGIDSVIEDIKDNPKTFNSIDKVLDFIANDINDFYDKPVLYKKDLSIEYYAKDERLGKGANGYGRTVYIVCTSKFDNEDYIKIYGVPQFVKYLIDLDEFPLDVKNISIDRSEGNCPNCGLKVTRKEDVNFCGTCGTPINWR